MQLHGCWILATKYSDSKIHVAHMGPTWVLSDPGGSQVGPMSLAIRVDADHLAYYEVISAITSTADNGYKPH